MAQWHRWLRVWLVLAVASGVLGAGAGGAAPAGAAGLPAPAPLPARPAQAAAAPADSAPALPPGCGGGTGEVGPRNVNKLIPDATSLSNPGVVTDTTSIPHLPADEIYTWAISLTVILTHTFSSDLELTLISPHGTRVTLAKHNGSSFDNIYNGVSFSDQAGLTNPPGPVTLQNFQNDVPLGLVNPQEPLSAFIGEDPHGLWTLEVRDNVPGDTGRLFSWTLSITALTSVPAAIPYNPAVSNAVTAIPDGHGQVDIPLTLNTLAPISALTLTTVITHPATNNLVLELVPPSGLTLTVSSHNPLTLSAMANVFAGTTWTDKAGATNPPGPVTDNTYQSGVVESPLAPQEGFGEVNGTSQSGAWHFIVRDTVTGTAGTLGRVSLSAMSLSCLPALGDGVGGPNRLGRLGKPVVVDVFPVNEGATAQDVLQTISVIGPYAYQSAAGPGWLCTPLAAGTLSPTINCVRNSLPQTADIFANPIQVTVTAPLIPEPAGISVSLSASVQGLIPQSHGIGTSITSYAESANRNVWDVLDKLNIDFGFPQDPGSVHNGGQGTFFSFGQIHVRALDLTGTVLGDAEGQHFFLTYAPGHRWQSQLSDLAGGIAFQRSLLAPAGADWLRYVDSFQNENAQPTQVLVSWGGDLQSGSHTQLAATSSGNLTLDSQDVWAVAIRQDAPNGPAVKPPVGLAFRSAADSSYQGPYVYSSNTITQTAWPSLGNGSPGQVFRFTLLPGETRKLAYFLARGLAEGVPGPADCDYYGGCVTPAAGSQVALIESTMAALAANPPFCDLSPTDRAALVNWPGVAVHCVDMPLALR